MTDSLSKLARRLNGMDREIRNLASQPRLAFSSLEDGSIDEYDIEGRLVQIIGKQYDGTHGVTGVNGPKPPAPTQPYVNPVAGGLRLYWDGTFGGGENAPMDFSRVSFYAVTDPATFHPLAASQIVGHVSSALGGEIFVSLPQVEHYVFAVTWSQSGNYSLASEAGFGTPKYIGIDDLDPEIDLGKDEPTEPPAESPGLTIYADSKGFTVEAAGLAPTSTVTYHMGAPGFNPGESSALMSDTTQTILRVEKDPATGADLEFGKVYEFVAIARNIIDSAPIGVRVQAELRRIGDDEIDTIIADKIVGGDLIGAFALLGALNVGANISISPDQGIEIRLSDGGRIKFPSNGDPAEITAEIVALAMTVKGNFRMLGTDNEVGTNAEFYLSSGVNNPTMPLQVSYTWPRYELIPEIEDRPVIYRTLGHQNVDGTLISAAIQRDATPSTGLGARSVYLENIMVDQVEKLASVTRLPNSIANYDDATNIQYPLGVARVGNDCYVLMDDRSRPDYYVYKVDATTGLKTAEWPVIPKSNLSGNATPQIATVDGSSTEVLIAYMRASDEQLIFRRHNINGTFIATHGTGLIGQGGIRLVNGLWTSGTPQSGGTAFVNLVYAQGGFPGDRWIAFRMSSAAGNWARVQGTEYLAATRGGLTTRVVGGTRNYHLGSLEDNALYGYFGRFATTSTTGARPTLSDEFTFSWYDSNLGGTGTHTSKASTNIRTLERYPNRALPVVTTPPLGDVSHADSANGVRVWMRAVGAGNTEWKRWTPPAGVTSLELVDGGFDASGQTLPAANTFPTAGLTPGSLRSAKSDLEGHLIILRGDGSGRLGTYRWNAAGEDISGEWVYNVVTGNADYAATSSRVKREGNRVEVRYTWSQSRAALTPSAAGGIANQVVGTLPTEFRIKGGEAEFFTGIWDGNACFGRILANGSIQIFAVNGGRGDLPTSSIGSMSCFYTLGGLD